MSVRKRFHNRLCEARSNLKHHLISLRLLHRARNDGENGVFIRTLFMKPIYIIFLILLACQAKEKVSSDPQILEPDTVIVKIDLNEELAGSAYRKRATGYFLMVDDDSSLYVPAFAESKEGRVSLMLGLYPLLTYQEQLEQLRALLPSAVKEYNFDSLGGVYVGRLVQTGDLAIDITNEYLDEFGGYGSTATSEYSDIANFLSRSKLGRDMNSLFAPYGLEVVGASVEKVFFTELHESIKIDSARHKGTKIPEQILDGMTWVELGPSDD